MKYIETWDGKEFQITDEQAGKISKILELINPPKFIRVDGRAIATNNIAGVFDEIDMKEKEYRKQGMWICNYLRWHYFKEICNCGYNLKYYGIAEFTDIKSKRLLELEAKGMTIDDYLANKDMKTIGDHLGINA